MAGWAVWWRVRPAWKSIAGAWRLRSTMGFTVVELLITLALISMIASIAIPNFISTIYTAKINRAILDIEMIQSEIDRFSRDNLFLPPDLETLEMKVPIDPFGRPYVYYRFPEKGFRSTARMDILYKPINTSYDLYSLGRDGKTAKKLDKKVSRDDIVRGKDGTFVGLAVDFN